jgi:steroid delta-isomerase-like uncharacterized protein
MTSAEKKVLLRSIYDPEIGYDMEKFYANSTDDFFFIRVPFPPVVGAEANRLADEATLAAFSNFRVDVEDMVAEGEVMAMTYTWKGIHTGTLQSLGLPATGKAVECSGCMLVYFKDDKIFKAVDYFDFLGFLQQLEVIPAFQ